MPLSRLFKTWPLLAAIPMAVVVHDVAAALRAQARPVSPTQYRYSTVNGVQLFYREAGDPAAPAVV